MKHKLLLAAAAGIITISFSTPSCKPDKPECDTAFQDTLKMREMRLQEREMALREREMAVMERERALGMSATSSGSYQASTGGKPMAENSGRQTVKGGRNNYTEGNNQVAYKKPVLDFPGQFPESSERALTEDDMEHKSAFGKKIMLNEIYARHGYIFPDKDLVKHFAGESWYKGTEKSLGKIKLTPMEVQNVAFIRKHM